MQSGTARHSFSEGGQDSGTIGHFWGRNGALFFINTLIINQKVQQIIFPARSGIFNRASDHHSQKIGSKSEVTRNYGKDAMSCLSIDYDDFVTYDRKNEMLQNRK